MGDWFLRGNPRPVRDAAELQEFSNRHGNRMIEHRNIFIDGKRVPSSATEMLTGTSIVHMIEQRLEDNGVEPFISTPEQFTQMMLAETDELVKVIKPPTSRWMD